MEFKLIRTSDYLKPLKENFNNILNEKYMNKLFYKIDFDEKEVYIKIDSLEDLIEFRNSVKNDIIIEREDEIAVIEIYDDWRE